MKKSKKILLSLLLVSSIALCGCSGNTKQQKENQEMTPEGESAVTQEAKDPVYGGSIVVGIQNDLDSLDPHKAKAAGTEEILFNIYEGLVKPDKDGNLIPAVASDVIVSDDGLTLSFPLRENVFFHDGSKVTAGDVIYSIKRCAGLLEHSDPEVQVERALSCILTVDSYTDDGKEGVRITLSEANSDILGYLTCAIVPKDYEKLDTLPMGTGPFRFVSYTPLSSIILAKNENYYVSGIPYLDEVTFKISANTDAAIMELLAGQIDLYPYLTAEQANQLMGNYNILKGSMNLVQGMYLNNKVKPFDNKLVRQALCYGINRQEIIDMVADGFGTVVGSPIFPQFTKYYDESLVDRYPYDTKKAKELLAQAGYPDGFSFTITVPSNYQFHVDTAQVIVEQLKQIGITAEIKMVEWASWVSDVYNGRDYQATIIGVDANMTPSNVCFRYVSNDPKNFINFANPEYDTIYKSAIVEQDEETKKADYTRLQEILSEEAASVYIQDAANIVAINKKLAGYTFYPVYVQDMSCVYFTE